MEATGLHVLRHDEADGWWEMTSRRPAEALRGLVRRYVGYREKSVVPVRRREVPTGDVHLIVSFGPPISVLDANGAVTDRRTPVSFVAPVSAGFALTEYVGEQFGLQVTLTPIGAGRLLGLPLSALDSTPVDLPDLSAASAAIPVERLAEAESWAARFDLMDGFLLDRFAADSSVSPVAARACDEIRRTHGQVAIRSLADGFGCSHRHLLTEFHRQIGLAPKTYARILRCRRAMNLLRTPSFGTLAEVAAACGYADHGHLSRDFRRITGLNPSAWRPELTLDVPELDDTPDPG